MVATPLDTLVHQLGDLNFAFTERIVNSAPAGVTQVDMLKALSTMLLASNLLGSMSAEHITAFRGLVVSLQQAMPDSDAHLLGTVYDALMESTASFVATAQAAPAGPTPAKSTRRRTPRI